jgi:hypothetical protein
MTTSGRRTIVPMIAYERADLAIDGRLYRVADLEGHRWTFLQRRESR